MTTTSTPRQRQAQPALELLPPALTVRVGKRRLTLCWRARQPLPRLLSRLLLRSWRVLLAPALRISVAAAAVCGAWQAPVLAAAPAPGTLPTGWSVVNGNVTFTQNGNTLNISQLSPQAIAKFVSFSIGSDAAVNVNQPSTAAALLAKVTGGDISQIYGRLSANGTVVLYNPNGVVIGPSGTIDAGRFIATSLAISDSDFLAGKLNFASQGNAGLVSNQGTIQSATGGSVYLIGGTVANSGVIRSPQGEVILAAGQTVALADTATPGVTVNVTGSSATVTNLGSITAEAGRIGVAAGLISNSGVINASSVVREGGRIFLRASSNLTTTASSSISADGTSGGNITLVAQNQAFIDGNVSAIGVSGAGGFVETSGLQKLDVVKAPTVGSGGTWLIDPYDLQVVSGSAGGQGADPNNDCNCYAVQSSGSVSQIGANTIVAQLNAGTSVTLSTGGGGSQAGNISVNADIEKNSSLSSSLTLNAANNISINANIISRNGALNLTLHTGVDADDGGPRLSTINNGAQISLNGGRLNVLDSIESNGDLLISNGSVSLGSCGSLAAHALQLGSAGSLTLNGSRVQVNSLSNNGTVTLSGGYSTLSVDNSLTNNGTLNINSSGVLQTGLGLTNNAGGQILLNASDTTFNTSGNGQWVNNGTLTVGGNNQVLSLGDKGNLINNGNLTVASNATLSGGEQSIVNNGTVTLAGGTLSFNNITNNQNATLTGSGNLTAYGTLTNNGTLTPGGDGSVGNLTIGGSFVQGASGKLSIDIASASQYDRIVFAGSSVGLGGTLNTHLLGSYVPGSSDYFRPFSFNYGTNVLNGSYFRNVTGDVKTVNNAPQMLKATYGEAGVTLAMTGAQTFYANSTWSGWGNASSWTDSQGYRISTFLPTQIDTVVVGSGVTASHGDGNDVLAGLQVASGGQLQQQAGNLTVAGSAANSSIAGTLNVLDGNVILNGSNNVTGVVNVSAGSVLFNGSNAVSGTVVLNGGVLTTNGTTSLTSASTVTLSGGNLTLNGTTALAGSVVLNGGNLTTNGSIDIASTGSLNVTSGNATLGGTTTGTGNITIGRVTRNDDGEGEREGSFNLDAPVADASLTLANAAQAGLNVTLNNGNMSVTGSARLSNLTVSNGTLTGTSGSRLVVANNFSQSGGTLNLADAAISQSSGNLTMGNVTASNLVLQAQNGNISQSSGTSLRVKTQLLAAAATGITLNASDNQIAGFAAYNSGTGNITLTNHLNTSDASVVAINGLYTARGNITVDNTGGLSTTAMGSSADFLASLPTGAGGSGTAAARLAALGIGTTGEVKSANGSVSLVTHSPLTIGSGGVNATGSITLTAGSSSGSNDNLIVNGVLVSLGGNITLSAGDTMTINANISTSPPGVALLSVDSGAVIGYATGVTITDLNGTRTPVPATVSSSTSASVSSTSQTDQVVQQQQNQQTQNLQSTVSSAQLADTAAQTTGGVVQQNTSANQTVGGTSGNFGDDGTDKKQGKKPLPMCT